MSRPDEAQLEEVILARPVALGGMKVQRVLPFRHRRTVGPFVFLDHGGPMQLPAPIPRSYDVPSHPHIGLSTLSYLLQGELMHRDSTGVRAAILPGEVNWMTAGRGVSHSERFEGAFQAAGGPLGLLQAWVGLPEAQEEATPSFEHHGCDALPILEDAGLWGRLIAGEAFGLKSPVRTHSPLFYLHLELQAGTPAELPVGPTERAAYVVTGRVSAAGQSFGPGQLLVFAPGGAASFRAEEASTVMLLGGESLGPRFIWWNFVASSQARIEAAKADWQASRIALPPDDAAEWVPLPQA